MAETSYRPTTGSTVAGMTGATLPSMTTQDNQTVHFRKTVTGLTDAAASTILTVVVPNVNFCGQVIFYVAITPEGTNAGESSRTFGANVTIVRIAGRAPTAAVGTIYGTAFSQSGANVTALSVLTTTDFPVAGADATTVTGNIKLTITQTGGTPSTHAATIYGILNVLEGQTTTSQVTVS